MNKKSGGWGIVVALSLVAVLAFALVPMASAQETTGGIKVHVKDKQGLVIPNATVELSGPALLRPRTLATDDAGYGYFEQLPPGEYTLSATAPNFQVYKVTGIALDVGKLPTFELSLQIGEISQTVEVTATAVLVDVTSSNVATVIPEDVIASIPKGSSYQTLIPFAPGARQEPLQSARTDRGRQNGFQIDGASDAENTYLVEGLDTSEIQSGGIKQNVVFEFIQEVQIKTSGLAAEYGGAMGGVINVIQKRGSNQWHGGLVTYYRSNKFDSNDLCTATPQPSPETTNLPSGTQLACGLRPVNGATPNAATRTDAGYEYYNEKQDQYLILNPGYEIGGPLLKDKLWLFNSYQPEIDKTSRTVNFTGANPGIRSFTQNQTNQNMLTRLDYEPFSKLHLYGAWQYGYSRIAGQLPNLPDSYTPTQLNTIRTTDPTTIRADTGSVNPSTILDFGGEWRPNSRTVISAKYGYFYYNTSDRGKPQGIRYLYNLGGLTVGGGSPTAACPGGTTGTVGINGCSLVPTTASPGAAQLGPAGFASLSPNQSTIFDVFSRKSFATDVSYTVSKWGTHNFKVGYGFNRLYNNVNIGINSALVQINWGLAYTPLTSAGAANCTAVEATFVGGAAAGCRGNMGYFTVSDGVDTAGQASSLNHGIYGQDSWTLGHGLTLNLGLRFDKEHLPPYSAGFPSLNFGWGSKVAPRIGAAYDLFHNGKVKIFADYAKFYDIMKYSLPRGSWGGDYWHDCTYAFNFFDYTTITPTAPGAHACQVSGPAAGVTVGTFIENQNWRAAAPILPADPIVDPNMKPSSQHEMILGADWGVTPNVGLEVRYARKRLDNTIEDMSIDDNTYYIGNPGSAYSDLLHRQLTAAGYPNPTGLCPTCPHQPPATRRYDGLETRLTYHRGGSLYGQIQYTYSKLTGNYSGLTDTEILDANGGRHNTNNNRSFDLPQMQYTTTGKVTDGPLATDRPNVLSMTGYYRLKWWKWATSFGLTQQFDQGTPKSTCVPVIDSSSSCMYWGNQRGNFANIHADSSGNFVLDSVSSGMRTPILAQTDLRVVHEFGVSKTNEAMKMAIEMNVTNLLNNDSVLSYNPNPFATTGEYIRFNTAANAAGTDFLTGMSGFDPIALINAEGSAAGSPLSSGHNDMIISNRYGLPLLTQARRTMRLAVRFTF